MILLISNGQYKLETTNALRKFPLFEISVITFFKTRRFTEDKTKAG
jgi:hypothetical protein